MPEDLKTHIAELPVRSRNQIWVTCRGENGADKEILGDIQYYPTRGFPSYFYPFLSTPGYLSPLVAVKFVRPTRKYSASASVKIQDFSSIKCFFSTFSANQIINIECRAWAKNVNYVGSFRDRQVSE